MPAVTLHVPTSFQRYTEQLLVRLGYLYPHVEFRYDDQSGEVNAHWEDGPPQASELKKEIQFQLYREKIYAETLSIRKRLHGHD